MLPSIGMELYPENIRQRPIYSVNAGLDRLYALNMVNQFLDYMVSQGVSVERKVYPDQEHGFDYRDKEFGTLCTLLRTWKRPVKDQIAWTFSPGIPNRPQSIVNWTISDVAAIRYVNGNFSGDSLTIATQGISSVTIDIQHRSDFIYVKIGQHSPKKISVLRNNYLRLQSMIMHSFPLYQDNNCFKITF